MPKLLAFLLSSVLSLWCPDEDGLCSFVAAMPFMPKLLAFLLRSGFGGFGQGLGVIFQFVLYLSCLPVMMLPRDKYRSDTMVWGHDGLGVRKRAVEGYPRTRVWGQPEPIFAI
jgi:hypothetical protein